MVKEKKLRKFANKIEGKRVTIEDLQGLCNEITEYYQSQGYITTRAKLLSQKVENGTVEITIDEGKYGDIAVTGNKWANEKYLNNILTTNGIREDKVLNVSNLERAIGDINTQQYIKGNVIINKGNATNLNDINLDVQDRFPIDFSVDWNNYGTELTGMQRALLKASYYNLTGNGDSLYGGAILGNGNFGSLAGYSMPIGNKGTTLNFGFSSYNVDYGGIYRNLGLYGKWRNFDIGLVQPIIRKGKWSVDGLLNFDICDVNQGINALGDLSTQKLRVLRSGIFARRNDSKGFWSSGIQASTGLPLMDASDIDGKFVKFNMSLNRLQMMPKRSMLLLSLNGQYAPNELLSPEKIALGGMNLRGYETASILGDCGIFGTLEYRTPVPGLRKILPERFKNYEENVKLGYFYDFGVVQDVNGYGNLLNGKNTNLLQSVGVGIHFPVGKLLMANFDVGVPIGDAAFANQSVRLTFSLSSSFQNMWNWKKIEKPTL